MKDFALSLVEAEVPQEPRMSAADKVGILASPFKLSSEHVHWGGVEESSNRPEYRDPDTGDSTKWQPTKTNIKEPPKKKRRQLD